MKKKKQRISDLFYDNRFLLVFSLLVAIGFWLIVVVEYGVEVEDTKTVSVVVDYEKVKNDFGLVPFGNSEEYKVDVTVSGKKYIIDSDDIVNDIVVKADVSYVTASGQNTLKLIASASNENALFNIVDLSQDEITVYFDYPGEKDCVIETDIVYDEDAVPDGYIVGKCILSEAEIVTVTGPESTVGRVSKVVARATVTGSMRENKTVDAELVALTSDGETVSNVSFVINSVAKERVRVTLPVYKIAVLSPECKFTGTPLSYMNNPPFEIEITPGTVTVGMPEKMLESKTTFKISTIDFSEINVGGNGFYTNASEIDYAEIVDGTEDFMINIKTVGVESKTLRVTTEDASENIKYINTTDNMNVSLNKLDFSEIDIIGPRDSLDDITSGNIELVADLSGISEDFKGDVSVDVRLQSDDCWAYGEYTVTVTVS